MSTWLDVPDDHPFGIDTLPYGVFSTADDPDPARRRAHRRPRARRRQPSPPIGRDAGLVGDGPDLATAWQTPSLNAFLALGRPAWTIAREWLTEILRDDVHRDGVSPHLHPLDDVALHLPIEVADYVDFYASEDHASNVGQIFRPDNAALPPNWKHLPIGYHGRSGTVVVSGTDVVRPTGQRKGPNDPAPVFGPSIRLDIEAELGYVVGGATALGSRVSVDEAADHLFGVVILNDWSARDIQAWEYVPLGPFLGKSFATSISAWVTPLEALAAARVPLPGQSDPEVLPYLRGDAFGLDVHVEVEPQRHGRLAPRARRDVLVAGPDARAPHRQRRLHPRRRPLRLGDDQRPDARDPRQPARADLERHRAADARRRLDPRLPRGRRHRHDDGLGPGSRRRAHRSRRGQRHHPPRPLRDRRRPATPPGLSA